MRKAMYICAAAAMALASCSGDETVKTAGEEDAISFRSIVGLNSRGTEVDLAGLKAANKLYVSTYKLDDVFYETLYNETEYNYNGAAWVSSPAQYWAGNKKLNFLLLYPQLSEWVTPNVGFDFNPKKYDTAVAITVDKEIADQKDYVQAFLKDVDRTSAPMSVTLRHVLSQVEVQAKNTNPNYIYKVCGIRLCGVCKYALLDLFSNTASAGGIVVNDTNYKNYETTYTTPVQLTDTPQTIMGDAGNAFLAPQGVTTTDNMWNGTTTSATAGARVGYYLSVLISITTKAGASVYPAKRKAYGWAAVPVQFGAWKAGNKYIYTLDFSNGAGQVDPTDPGADVDAGGADPDKAEPILGSAISFTVKVADWTSSKQNVELN